MKSAVVDVDLAGESGSINEPVSGSGNCHSPSRPAIEHMVSEYFASLYLHPRELTSRKMLLLQIVDGFHDFVRRRGVRINRFFRMLALELAQVLRNIILIVPYLDIFVNNGHERGFLKT